MQGCTRGPDPGARRISPGVNYNTQALYTDSNGPGKRRALQCHNAVMNTSARQCASNPEPASIFSFRRASRPCRRTREAEIAFAVGRNRCSALYAVSAAQQKLQPRQKTADEGERFLKLTQDSARGEVAIPTSSRPNYRCTERRRQLLEAQLGVPKQPALSGVLIFSGFNATTRSPTISTAVPAPPRGNSNSRLPGINPDLRAALARSRRPAPGSLARAPATCFAGARLLVGIDAPRYAANSVINVKSFRISVLLPRHA